jgi:hypothetical protein
VRWASPASLVVDTSRGMLKGFLRLHEDLAGVDFSGTWAGSRLGVWSKHRKVVGKEDMYIPYTIETFGLEFFQL